MALAEHRWITTTPWAPLAARDPRPLNPIEEQTR
jgi:hypothetical protein